MNVLVQLLTRYYPFERSGKSLTTRFSAHSRRIATTGSCRTSPGLWALLCLCCLPAPAFAQYLEDGYSAQSMGMGGAARILATDTSAIEQNPALLASLRFALAQADYRAFPSEGANQGTFATIDGVTAPVTVGVQWRWSEATEVPGSPREGWEVVGEDPETLLHYRSQDYRVGLGLPLGSAFAFGTSFGWRHFREGEAAYFDAYPGRQRFVLNGALQFRPSQFFAVALIGNNLVPTHRPELPTTATVAAAAQASKYLMAEANLEVDFTHLSDLEQVPFSSERISTRFHVGGGLLAREYFPLRIGYYQDSGTDQRFLTGGVGVASSRLSVSYALRYALQGESASEGRFMHLLSFELRMGGGDTSGP